MSPSARGSVPRDVVVLVYDGVRLLDVTGPVEVFASANDFGAGYRTHLISLDGKPVRTSAGAVICVDGAAVDDFPDTGVLVVPGTPNWAEMIENEPMVSLIRTLSETAERTVSICTGAFMLAAAGLLDGRRATTHWRYAPDLARLFPRVRVEPDALFVADGDVVTSAGVSSGIDLSLWLVESDYDQDISRGVARDMVLFMQRPGGQSQFSARARCPGTKNPTLRQLLDAVAFDPAADHSLAAMARATGLSIRQLSRTFRCELGMTPARYVENVRLEAARDLLETGDEPLVAVARRVGFGSPDSLRRIFTRQYGTTPGVYRARFQDAVPD